MSTDQLIDELWEGQAPGNPRNALQANVARLRRFLDRVEHGSGARMVRTTAHGYVLEVSQDSIDATAFERHAHLGMELATVNPLEAITVLEDALAMWRGRALLDVEGGLRCRAEGSRLNERRLDVRKELIEARMDVGADLGVVSELKQLSAEHPADERLRELLMLALYRGGRQSEALAVFQSTRVWLAAEFGLEPGRGLRQVQQAILAQDRSLDALPFALPAL